MIFFRSSWRLMPSAVCWSKMVLRLSVSFTLARVMWRSNLSSGTSCLCLDAMIAFRWFITKKYFASLHFAQQDSTGPNYTLVCFTPLCLDVAWLRFAQVCSTLLYSTMFGYNFALLYSASLNSARLYSTSLNFTLVGSTILNSTLFGYNFAMHRLSTLHSTLLDWAQLYFNSVMLYLP